MINLEHDQSYRCRPSFFKSFFYSFYTFCSEKFYNFFYTFSKSIEYSILFLQTPGRGNFGIFGGIIPFNFIISEIQIALKMKENDTRGQQKVTKFSGAPNDWFGIPFATKRRPFFQGFFFQEFFLYFLLQNYSILFTIESRIRKKKVWSR